MLLKDIFKYFFDGVLGKFVATEKLFHLLFCSTVCILS